MIIATRQLILLSKKQEEDFVKRSIAFLKNNFAGWTAKKEPDQIFQFVNGMIKFGGLYEIKEEINLQKLMFLEIKYEFLQSEAFNPVIQEILTFPGRPENLKMNYLHKQLVFTYENTLAKQI